MDMMKCVAQRSKRKYIDADKLKRHYAWWEDGTYEMTLDEAREAFDEIIDQQPAADVVEVVRCKDCKHHYDEEHCDLVSVEYEDGAEGLMLDDYYCCWGERRDE